MDQAILSPAICYDLAPEPSLSVDTKAQPDETLKDTQNEDPSAQTRASPTEEETVHSLAEVNVTMVQPRTFHLFPKLPAEIQHMIFREAFPGPRLVEVTACFADPTERWLRIPCSFTSRTPPPPFLHVCHASRLEVLKRFKPCFSLATGQPIIYFDFKVDTLFITCDGSHTFPFGARFFHSNELMLPLQRSLKHFIIPWCMRNSNHDWKGGDIVQNIKHLQNLKTVTLVKRRKVQCRKGWIGVGLRPFINWEDLEVDFDDCVREMGLNVKNWSSNKLPIIEFMRTCGPGEEATWRL